MSNYQTIKITPDFYIQVLPYARGFTLSDHEKMLVENIWRHEETARSSTLHNGQILNVVSVESDRLVGEFIEYKYYLAQLRDPNFDEVLKIRTLAISGITTTVDKILIGLRAGDVSAYQGHYEFVPSGGIDPGSQIDDRINVARQFETELWEESGISVTEVKDILPLALVFDSENKIYEMCAELSINYSILREQLRPNDEYQKLEWISKREIKDFIAKHEEKFVPFSLYLLKLAGLK